MGSASLFFGNRASCRDITDMEHEANFARQRGTARLISRRVRHDRIPISDLKGLVLRVRVRDVKSDSKQQALDDINCYSVIEEIIGPET